MQHFRLRCKHCGKEYTYCTYGNGPEYGTQEGCSMEYCAECQKAIDKALETIPRRYVVKYTLLDDSNDKGISKIRIDLNKVFDEEREKYNETAFIKFSQMIPDWGYEDVEKCFIDGIEYFRCTKKDGSTVFLAGMEYDVIDKKLTGNNYFDNNNPHRRYVPVCQAKVPPIDLIPVKPLTKPKGDCFYMGLPDAYEWEIKLNNKDKED